MCLCKGEGRLLRAYANKLIDLGIKARARPKTDNRRLLVDGFFVLALTPQSVEGVTARNELAPPSAHECVDTCWLHVGLMYLSPFRPTFQRMERSGEEPFADGCVALTGTGEFISCHRGLRELDKGMAFWVTVYTLWDGPLPLPRFVPGEVSARPMDAPTLFWFPKRAPRGGAAGPGSGPGPSSGSGAGDPSGGDGDRDEDDFDDADADVLHDDEPAPVEGGGPEEGEADSTLAGLLEELLDALAGGDDAADGGAADDTDVARGGPSGSAIGAASEQVVGTGAGSSTDAPPSALALALPPLPPPLAPPPLPTPDVAPEGKERAAFARVSGHHATDYKGSKVVRRRARWPKRMARSAA